MGSQRLTETYCEELRVGTLYPPDGSITNAAIQAGAGILASKLDQHHSKTYGESGTATSVTIPIHVVRGATATIRSIHAGSVTLSTGTATVVVDLRKNGTTALSATITLDTANTAYTPEAGTVDAASEACVVDDVLTLVITATAPGTSVLATGLFVEVRIDEDYPS